MIARLKQHPFLLTIVLSLLLHTALLFGPNLIKLAPVEVPPLIAHLEALPVIKKPAAPPRSKPHPKPRPKLIRAPLPVALMPEISSVPVTAIEALPAEVTQNAVVATPVESDITVPVTAASAHPLPRHAQLTFIAYKGTNLRVGEARHRLDIDEQDHYTLQVGMNTSGIASLFKTFVMNQQSSGMAGPQGLQPDHFTDQRLTSKGKQDLSAQFDWKNKQLIFSSAEPVALPDTAQDNLSILYQFSQLPLNQATLNISVCNGKKLEVYQVEVGDEAEISTPMGKLRALPLRKVHAQGEEGLEIWLGLEYRLLPVKIVQINRSGEVAGELDISEIQVSGE